MKSSHQAVKAAALALTSTSVLSFIDNFVVLIATDMGLWQFQVLRTLFALPILLLVAKLFKQSLKIDNFKKTMIRSLSVSLGLLIYFAALGVLSVSQAGAGLFSAPMWVLIFSILIFSMKVSILQLLGMFAGFIGVVMVLQPDLSHLSVLSFLPLIAGALYGFGMLLTRHWCHQESAITLAIGVFITMGLFSCVFMIGFTFIWPVTEGGISFITQGWVAPDLPLIGLIIAQAIGSVIAVCFISQAYRIGEPSHVAVFEYSFLVFAAVWAYILWGTTINVLAMSGIVVIFVAGICVSFFVGTKASLQVELSTNGTE